MMHLGILQQRLCHSSRSWSPCSKPTWAFNQKPLAIKTKIASQSNSKLTVLQDWAHYSRDLLEEDGDIRRSTKCSLDDIGDDVLQEKAQGYAIQTHLLTEVLSKEKRRLFRI